VRLVSGAVEPVGAVVHALSLADGLQALGHEAEVWAPAGARAALEGGRRAGVRAVPVPDSGVDPEDRALMTVAALSASLAAAEPADVHHAQDSVAGAALLKLRAGGGTGAVVRTVHHVEARGLPSLDELERASIRNADACICVTAFWAARLRAEYGVEATVVRSGVDVERFASSPLTRAEAGLRFGWGARPAVLALGGISRRKGSRVLLEAFARARSRLGDDGLLAIAGPGTDDQDYVRGFRADAARLGLEIAGPRPAAAASVALLGAVPASDMPALYRAVDALAYPSTREGFGLAVLEAASAGLPAAVSDLPVLRETLADGRDCLMVPAGHSGPLADALVRLVRDEALRVRLVAGGRATAGRFSWAAAARGHLRLYEGLPAAR
jgi:glycosyltransferase-like protein